MMWRVFQTTVAAAVMCANVYYNVTPNPYVSGGFGILLALGFTWVLSKSIDLLRRKRRETARQ